jgi:hypothetical protein
VGVTASVAAATTSASAIGSRRWRASPRSTRTTTATRPAATHGSGRSPRLIGSHQAAKTSAAARWNSGCRANPPSRGSRPRLSTNQVSRPSSEEGTRIQTVASLIFDQPFISS